jgi:hypothetical protein
MRRIGIRGGLVVVGAAVAVLLNPVAAPAETLPPADVAITGSTVEGHLGQVVELRHTLDNYGPNIAGTGMWYLDLTAPGGTEFRAIDFEGCTQVVALHHYRCRSQGQLWVDNVTGGQGVCCWSSYVPVTVTSLPVTPGRIEIDYANDPKLSNNVSQWTVQVPGQTPTPARTTKAPTSGGTGAAPTTRATSPLPATTATDATTASASPAEGGLSSLDPLAVAATGPFDGPGSLAPTATFGHPSSAYWWWAGAVTAVLIGAGAWASVVLLRRRRSNPAG